MEATMAMHDFDYPTESLHQRDSAFDDARRLQPELDKGTLWAGAMLGAALTVFIAYMMMASPPM